MGIKHTSSNIFIDSESIIRKHDRHFFKKNTRKYGIFGHNETHVTDA